MRPYVSIDIETTGLDPDTCQILEIGAVVDNWVTPIDRLRTFHCYVAHDKIYGEPFALAMNAEILRRIAERDKPENSRFRFFEPSKVLGAMHEWLAAWYFSPYDVLAAGKNFASFDLQFLNKLDDYYSDRIKFHHRFIDPCMLYWNPATDQEPPSTKVCMERAGIPGEVAHTAVEDALTVVKLIRHAHP